MYGVVIVVAILLVAIVVAVLVFRKRGTSIAVAVDTVGLAVPVLGQTATVAVVGTLSAPFQATAADVTLVAKRPATANQSINQLLGSGPLDVATVDPPGTDYSIWGIDIQVPAGKSGILMSEVPLSSVPADLQQTHASQVFSDLSISATLRTAA